MYTDCYGDDRTILVFPGQSLQQFTICNIGGTPDIRFTNVNSPVISEPTCCNVPTQTPTKTPTPTVTPSATDVCPADCCCNYLVLQTFAYGWISCDGTIHVEQQLIAGTNVCATAIGEVHYDTPLPPGYVVPVGCCNQVSNVRVELNMCDLTNYYYLAGTELPVGPCLEVGNCPQSPTLYCGTVNTYTIYPGERFFVGVYSPKNGDPVFGIPNIKPITLEVYKNSVLVFYDVLREFSEDPTFISYIERIQGSNTLLVKIYDQPPALSSTPTPTPTKTKTPTPTITKSPTPTKTRP